ncbi:hypothetical protein ACH4TE_14350 [Streptomyces sioyaensis]|uniref:hypothetical protein n=1 Tax=Streptomyces sioyaensis TaxID=67364 RepID=UPI0037A2B2B7
MPSCIYCGARCEDPAATSCPSCGMPHEGGAPQDTGRPAGAATRYGYVRVGATVLPQWLLWLVAALLVVGGVTAYLLPGSSTETGYSAVDTGPSTEPPSEPGPGVNTGPPTDAYSPAEPETWPPTVTDSPTVAETSPSPEDASAVVKEFYQDINARDFTAAWDLGGKNIGGSSFSRWVSGYNTTVYISLSAVNAEDTGKVRATLNATQNNGSVKVFHGTYTVSDGAIVSADITED